MNKKVPIGDRIAFEYGFAVRANNEEVGEYPVFGSNGATGFINSYKLKGPGVIVGRKGSVGKVVYTEKNFTPTDTAYYLRILNESTDDLRFWSYFLPLLGIEKLNSHSAVPGLSRELAYFIEVEIPKIENQKKIGKTLAKIDKKIELNNQINAELEAMAKTLYDYWFVQFDFPDADGKPYKSSGGKMVYNEVLKREIPEGWKDSTIESIESNIVTGKTPSKKKPEYFDGDIPFITIGDIRANTFIVQTEETLTSEGADTQKNKYLPEDTICVTCIASPGLVGFVTEKSQTNQQINSVVCSNRLNIYYLYFAIKAYFEGAKAKTGNTFANMNKGDFSSINMLYPNKKLLTKYYEVVDPLFRQIKVKTLENKELENLRDWLLPMLMNGQVTVK